MNPSEVKSTRLLTIYSELVNGAVLQKSELAHRFHITQRSVQRDIESLRFFFAEQMLAQDIVYDNREKGYRLTNTIPKSLSNSEILAVCKILLESRSMVKEELSPILDKLVDCCVPAESKKAVQELPHCPPTGAPGPLQHLHRLPPAEGPVPPRPVGAGTGSPKTKSS